MQRSGRRSRSRSATRRRPSTRARSSVSRRTTRAARRPSIIVPRDEQVPSPAAPPQVADVHGQDRPADPPAGRRRRGSASSGSTTKSHHVQARLPAQPDGHGVPAHARGAHGLPRLVRRTRAVRQGARPRQPARGDAEDQLERASRHTGAIKSFTPRISSASIVKKVTVKGWNPETKELITGRDRAQTRRSASENAVAACGQARQGEETFTVDHADLEQGRSRRAREGAAHRAFADVHHGRVPRSRATRRLDLGKIIEIEANEEPDSRRRSVQRQVLRHGHHPPPLPCRRRRSGGYSTILRARARCAEEEVT